MTFFRSISKTFAAVLLSTPAFAQDVSDMVEVSVLEGWRTATGDHVAALHFDLGDGWKTYWRAPGDAGIPPEFSWYGSSNVDQVTVEWPTPKPVPQFGYMTIGYDQDVIIPLRVLPQNARRDMRLQGKITLGVCKDVCVPITVNVKQDLSKSSGKPDPKIVAALASRPFSAREGGVRKVTCRLSPLEDGLKLTATVDMPKLGNRELAVVEARDPKIWIAPTQTTRQGNVLTAQTTMHHVDGRSFAVDRKGLRITVLGKGQAVDIQGCSAD